MRKFTSKEWTLLRENTIKNRRIVQAVTTSQKSEDASGQGLLRSNLQELLKMAPTFSDFVEMFTLPPSTKSDRDGRRRKRR
ncbi:MAG: hypothetical protein ACK5O7_06950 [Holosporales bacterium]